MRRALFLCVVLACLVMPTLGASSVKTTFQDFTPSAGPMIQDGWYFSNARASVVTPTTTGQKISRIQFTSFLGASIKNSDPAPYTYAAFTVVSRGSPGSYGTDTAMRLYGPTGTVLYQPSLYTKSETGNNDRFEVVMSPGGIATIYKNGVLKSQSGVLTQTPSYLEVLHPNSSGAGINIDMDNFVLGYEDDSTIIGVIPSDWYIQYNALAPATTGLYQSVYGGSPVLKNSNYYGVSYGRGIATATTLDIINPQGVTVKSYPVANMSCQCNLPISDLYQDGTITNGLWRVTLADDSESAYFWVSGSGASVAFDADSYSVDDTASISYNILAGSWDPVTYTYKMIIQDIFGNVVSTQTITSQTGSKTYTFDSSDTNGVYYAIVIATPIAGGDENWVGYDSAELSSYITIEGYINNAQTAIPINISYVNITQGSLVNAMTTVDGKYSTTAGTAFLTGSSITINATSTGFKQYLYSFTPSTGSKKVINITLDPIAPTHTGIALGGTCRDSVYGRPINYCAVTVANATYGESYAVTANNAGYYLLDESDGVYLTNGRWYSVAATKLGFSNSASYLKAVWGA